MLTMGIRQSKVKTKIKGKGKGISLRKSYIYKKVSKDQNVSKFKDMIKTKPYTFQFTTLVIQT